MSAVTSQPAERPGERGAVSVSLLLLAGVIGLIIYAVFSAATADPDRYGRVPVPSVATVSLPGAETGISWVEPGATATVAPVDLKIDVINPVTRVPVEVNSKGGGGTTEDGEAISPVARVDPPEAGAYEVRLTSTEAAARPGAQVAFGESPAGAVGDRLGNVLDLLKGPVGVAFILLLAGLLVYPVLQRRARSG